ncbi:MAG: DUF4105 domain-containing protein [Bacteroidaceae bacterium]|nr:DUF4105 domain-containing protein [Bacteroidaceae bacterium]
MKNIRILLATLLCFFTLQAQSNNEDIEISVLTCSPGQEVYSYYGHTAIRYKDIANSIDLVFNYGVFNFNTDYFIWKFVLGETDYLCIASPWDYFIQEYKERGSNVIAQVLNTTPEEEKNFKEYLFNNIKPENSTYRYNFLTDNCTMRVLDCVERCIEGEINYSWDNKQHTYRQILHEYTKEYPWAKEGNDFLLGANVDTILSHRATCFIPEYYNRAIENAVIRNDFQDTRNLVQESIIFEAHPTSTTIHGSDNTSPLKPTELGWFIFSIGILILIIETLTHKVLWVLDLFLMLLHGVAGCLILFVFLFSQHPTLDSNWLVCVINPLPLILLPFITKSAWKKQVNFWHHVLALWMIVFLLFIPWIPQEISLFTILLLATLLSRQVSYLINYSFFTSGFKKKNISKRQNKASKKNKR